MSAHPFTPSPVLPTSLSPLDGALLAGVHLVRVAGAEQELVGLLVQELLGLGVAHVQAVVVDEHGLLLEPLLPADVADAVLDALAQVVVERRVRQPGPGLSAARAGDVGHRIPNPW